MRFMYLHELHAFHVRGSVLFSLMLHPGVNESAEMNGGEYREGVERDLSRVDGNRILGR